MTLTLPIVLAIVLAYFGVFVAALAYGQWQTRDIAVYRADQG